MKRPTSPIWLLTPVLLLGALAMAASGNGQDGKEDPRESGRALYSGDRIFSAPAMLSGVVVTQNCSQCHGRDGRGRSEGGVRVPAITWEALMRPGSGRPAYADSAAVIRAITDGVGADGGRLRAPMPQFQLSREEAVAITAWLHALDQPDAVTPGVEADRLRIACILPLSGPLSGIGSVLRARLQERIDQRNVQGGIYGRRLQLEVFDGGSDAASLRAMLQKVRGADHHLLIAASYVPEREWTSHSDSGSAAAMPVLAGLAVGLAPPDASQRTLLPSLEVQVRALAARLDQDCAGAELEVFHQDSADGDRLAAASGVPLRARHRWDGSARLHPERGTHRPRAVLSLLDAAGTRRIREQLAVEQQPDCLGSVAVLAGSVGPARALPNVRELVVLPLSIPGPVLAEQGGRLWPILADTAADVLLETLARAGRRVTRDAVLAANDGLSDLQLRPGLVLNYSPVRRHGFDPGFLTMGGSGEINRH